MSSAECKQIKKSPASDWLKDSRGSSHGRRLSLSLSSLSLGDDILSQNNDIDDRSHNVRSASEGISECESNYTLIYDGSGRSSWCCSKHNNKAHSYSYSMCSSSSSSNSPPWSPYCSPATKYQAAIPFSWEHKPGVPKLHKSPPTPHRSFPELPPPPPSEFSVDETFQVERRLRRRHKKRTDDVDPFVSALVECTKQQAAAMSMSKDGRPVRRKPGYGSTYSCIKSCAVTADAQIAIPTRARQSNRQSNTDSDEWRKPQNALAAIISSDHRRHRSHERLLYYDTHSDNAQFLQAGDPKAQLQRSAIRDLVPHKRQLRPAFMESWDVELHKSLVRH